MSLKVYVAGAWTEQHFRARPMMARLREAGVEITFDWCTAFNGIGVGSDSALSDEDRLRIALLDLDGVLRADVVWLLAPHTQQGCGSWVELGAALTLRKIRNDLINPNVHHPVVVVSGPKCKRTIFTELADFLVDDDEEAFAFVRRLIADAPWSSGCKRCGAPKEAGQVFCGAACSALWEIGDKGLAGEPKEPAGFRKLETPDRLDEDFQRKAPP